MLSVYCIWIIANFSASVHAITNCVPLSLFPVASVPFRRQFIVVQKNSFRRLEGFKLLFKRQTAFVSTYVCISVLATLLKCPKASSKKIKYSINFVFMKNSVEYEAKKTKAYDKWQFQETEITVLNLVLPWDYWAPYISCKLFWTNFLLATICSAMKAFFQFQFFVANLISNKLSSI